MGYMRDAAGTRLDTIDFARTFPEGRYGIPQRDILGRWDASTVPGVDGAKVAALVDSSGNGADVQAAGTARPMLRIEGGQRHLEFGAGTYLARATFGNGWSQPAGGYAQPLTILALCRFNTTAPNNSTPRKLIGQSGSAAVTMQLRYNIPVMQLVAPSNGAYGGPALNDHQWHIVCGVFDTVASNLYIDGYLCDAQSTQQHGANALQYLVFGGDANGGNGMDGDIREILYTRTALTPGQVGRATELLGQKWGLS